jgi:ribosomal protein S18 acetylase RimI-like enzyme
MHVLTAVSPLTFVELWRGGSLISRGRGTVTDGWLGLFNIATVPAARGRGLAGAAIGRLARWAREFDATSAYLQVEASNSKAQGLYDRLGFRTHHRYTRYGLTA